MIIYLYGKDSYRRKQKLSDILNNYKEKHPNSDIEEFNLSEDESQWEEAQDFLKQPSMFADAKMAVVSEGTKVDKKGWVNTLKEYIDNDSIFIIVTDSSKKPKKKFSFLLDDEVKYQEFKELKGATLRKFLSKLLKQENLELDKKAQDFLFSYISASDHKSWLAVNEIKKIALSKFKSPVSVDDLETIIHWMPTGKMFNETRKLFRSGVPPLLKFPVLEKLIIREETDSHVFNLLGYQAKGERALLLADLDIKIKSGKMDYEEALLDFVLKS